MLSDKVIVGTSEHVTGESDAGASMGHWVRPRPFPSCLVGLMGSECCHGDSSLNAEQFVIWSGKCSISKLCYTRIIMSYSEGEFWVVKVYFDRGSKRIITVPFSKDKISTGVRVSVA